MRGRARRVRGALAGTAVAAALTTGLAPTASSTPTHARSSAPSFCVTVALPGAVAVAGAGSAAVGRQPVLL